MSRTSSRLLILSVGGLVGILLVACVAWVTARSEAPTSRSSGQICQPYFLIPREKVCAQRVLYRNPDGSLVDIGSREALAPMPSPPQKGH